MDDSSLEETASFDRATLEISKGNENRNDSSATAEHHEDQLPSGSQDLQNIPFKNVNVNSFFTDRNEVVDRAIQDCRSLLVKEEEIIGSWLLTEISIWDTEKERLVLLTKKALYSVKYDFISLQILQYDRVPLAEIDTLIKGELIYPPTSLMPHLNGFADGVSSVIHRALRQRWSSLSTPFGLSQFEPKKRQMSGIRIMWNKGRPLSLDKKFNPFAKNIPWITYSSHPLYWHRGLQSEKSKFSVEDLYRALVDSTSEYCKATEASIVVENYFGIGALVHNRNYLGFFKIRGKVSF